MTATQPIATARSKNALPHAKRPIAKRLLVVALLAFGALMAFVATPAAATTEYRHGGRDVVEFGSDVTIASDQTISGDVVVFGGNLYVHGHIEGSAVAFGGDLHIFPEGAVDRDTVSIGGEIINESRTTPPKHRRTAPAVPPFPPISPMPEVSPPEMPPMPEEPAPEVHVSHPSFGAVWASIVIPDALLTLLMFFLFPARTRNVEEHLVAQPIAAPVLGFVTLVFLLPIVLCILLVLLVTIPLIPVAIIALYFGYLIGKAAVASFLGRRLLEAAKVNDPRPLASVIVGLVLMLILTGPTPAWFAITMFAFIAAVATGAALLSFARKGPGGQVVVGGVLSHPPAAPGAPGFSPPAGPAASGPPAIPQ